MVKQIPFAKFQAVGNDFIVVETQGRRKSWRALARKICDRRMGIGADGLLVVGERPDRQGRFPVRVINADGNEAEISGNGLRIVAAYLLRRVRRAARKPIFLKTKAGVREVVLLEASSRRWVFRVDMGKPVLDPKKIPFKAGVRVRAPVLGFLLNTHRGVLPVTVTSMGNPHCSVFVAEFAYIDWASLGAEIEESSHFPNGTNVEFVKVVSKKEIRVRFWERGVGMTLSSGSGSCAAAVASILNGLTEREVRVTTVAGAMQVSWPENGSVFLTGPVELIARGTYTL